jgi:hypothetical protein
MTNLMGVPCPVPNCQGYVKDVSEDRDSPDYRCEYGHILEEQAEGTVTTGRIRAL